MGSRGEHWCSCTQRGAPPRFTRRPKRATSTRTVELRVTLALCGECSARPPRFGATVNKLRETEPETQRTGAETGWNRGRVGRPTAVGSNGETNGDAKFYERLRGRAGGCRQQTGTQMNGAKEFGSSGSPTSAPPSEVVLSFEASSENKPSDCNTRSVIVRK